MLELSRKPEATNPTARDIHDFTHDFEFITIIDRNSQLIFLRKEAAFECGLSINGKRRYPKTLTEDQKPEIIELPPTTAALDDS
jgi:hypothetical protein